jgi:hypothetical protein
MIDSNKGKNLKIVKLVGSLFTLIGLYFTVVLGAELQFDINPTVWFTPQYYLQFIPFYTAIMLLLSGLFLFTQFSQANIYLAVFGHTASEEILFSWIGDATTQLPLSAIIVFFPLSLLALWLGYFNVLKQKRLSVIWAILSFVTSTAFVLLPRYL